MDEEQEHTYQSESAPRFDAHDVAKKRAVMENALLLFASATPLTETYHAAESGKLQLVQLTHRYGGRPLPSVDFIDMRAELAAGNPREVSVRLARELQENLDNGEQSILLLNRRGYRTIGMCTTCGHVLKCPNCSVPLVYHKPQQALLCHHCGHTVHPLPQTCPECGGKIRLQRLRYPAGGGGAGRAAARCAHPADGSGFHLPQGRARDDACTVCAARI